MARMRMLKPDFFFDHELDQLSEVHQKLFIGLWCLADKEGKLVDKPQKIKAQIFPYRDYDTDPLLNDLHVAGFIIRYEVNGLACIKVTKFEKHQKPHPKEGSLGLPNPLELVPSREISRQEINDQPTIPSSPRFVKSLMELNFKTGNGGGNGIGEDENPQPPPKSPSAPPQSTLPLGVPPDVAAPTTDSQGWNGEEFWTYFQWKRQEARLVPERPPRIERLGAWWSTTRAVVRDVDALKEAVFRYGQDKFWQDKKPPLPFSGFMAQWQDFMPQMEAG